VLSPDVRHAAAHVWRIRERTEHEAATLFDRLSCDLMEAHAPYPFVDLAMRCADDERRHAIHCRAVVDSIVPALPALAPDPTVRLGPAGMSAAQRALYTSVALGCVTESLSTALLLEMRGHAEGIVREALDVIVRDEVRHSRLGWAHLAWAATRSDVRWLTSAVPVMLASALEDEVPASAHDAEDRAQLAALGILAPDTIARIADETVRTTILPGLARYGVAVPLAA
jgi:hypothetical protein